MSDSENCNLPDGYRWVRYEMQQITPTISIYCREKCIASIGEKLSELGGSVLNSFKTSCFGKLYNLPSKAIRNNQAIHYVLSREVSRLGADATEMWFYVADTLIRFSRFEFGLMTGLRFGKAKFDPYASHSIPENSVYTRVLKDKPIKVADLFDRFQSNDLGGVADDYLKVAKIIFAYSILIGLDAGKTFVADWMWVLVEDSKSFDSFPWGSYSYQHMIHYLGNIKTKPTGGKREQYHFYGCATAFLGWIYCAIPKLGEVYGGVQSYDKIPRILRFRFMRSNLEVENVSGEIHTTLEPSNEERNKSFWKSIEREGTPFKFQYSHARKATSKGKGKVLLDEEEENEEEGEENEEEGEENEEEDENEEEQENVRRREESRSKKKHDKSRVKHRLRRKVVMDTDDDDRDDHHHSDYHFDDQDVPFQSRGAGGSSSRASFDVDDMMSRLEPRFTDLKNDIISHFEPQFNRPIDWQNEMMSRLEPRFTELKNDMISYFDPQFNKLMDRQNEIMSHFNDSHFGRERDYEPYQYWDLQEKEIYEEENNEEENDKEGNNEENNEYQGNWCASQQQFAAEGQQWGGIGTEQSWGGIGSQQTWHSSYWGTEWTDCSDPLWGTPGNHGGLSQFASQKTPVQQPLITGESSITRFTMPDFRTIRQRKPSRALQSPFLVTDKRGGDYAAYRALGDKAPLRNVGISYGVGHDFFASLEDEKSELDIEVLDAYLAILHTDPIYCRVQHNRTDVVITSASFMHSVDNLWKKMHKDDPRNKSYDPTVEEIVPPEELKCLSVFVTGDAPNWGERKPWWDYKKLVMVAHIPGHWITLQVNFDTCSITVYDSLKSKWTKSSATATKKILMPLSRILPQLLKYTSFYDLHNSLTSSHAKFTQWDVKFPSGDELFQQKDSTSCGLYALKYVEALISGNIALKLTSADLKNYRMHIAKTIYKFSTDGDTVPVPFDT